MILKLWLQISLIFVLACGPLFILEYFQYEETLQLTLNSGPEKLLAGKIPEVLQQLKDLSNLQPSQSAHYYAQFTEWSEIQKSMIEWENLKPIIEKKAQRTTIVNAFSVMVLALLMAFIIARSITRQFHKLLRESHLSIRREAELQGLTQWQVTARNLVHELRGPLTPIKLVTSSLYEEAQPLKLEESQKEGLQLSLQKIQQMEQMIQKFMTFAKLPEAYLEPKYLSETVQSFLTHYQNSFNERLKFIFIKQENFNEGLILLDESLLHNTFFAMAQNAAEALDSGETDEMRWELIQNESHRFGSHLELLISNKKTQIPSEIETQLFQIGASSKLNRGPNFGIGLAMAKKIMLDHGGDLILWKNSKEEGVSFKFIFPTQKKESLRKWKK